MYMHTYMHLINNTVLVLVISLSRFYVNQTAPNFYGPCRIKKYLQRILGLNL